MAVYDFVKNLFEKIKQPNTQNTYIQRANGVMVKFDIVPDGCRACIWMDGVKMGYFEEADYRGYEYVFHQQYRIGIRNGLTPNESLMKSICETNGLIDFHNA